MNDYRDYQSRSRFRPRDVIPSRSDDSCLLDGPELNLGSTKTVPRIQVTGAGWGDEVRLLDLTCTGRNAEVVTVCMGQLISRPEPTSIDRSAFVTGPVTGIIEFGNGAAWSRIEFDLPPPSRTPFNPVTSSYGAVYRRYASRWNSGLTLAVPGSSVRVLARNENNMPLLTTPGTIYGVSNVGDLDPTVYALIGYGATFGGNRRSLRKTIKVGTLAAADSTTNYVPIGIPAFSKQVTFFRSDPATTSFQAVFSDMNGSVLATYNVAANQWGPYDVPVWADYLDLTNTGGAQMTNTNVVFDLCI